MGITGTKNGNISGQSLAFSIPILLLMLPSKWQTWLFSLLQVGFLLRDAAQAKLRSGAAGGPVPPSLPQLSARRSTHALLPEKLSPSLRPIGQNGAGSGQTLQDTAVPAFKQTPGMYHNIAKTQISGFFKRELEFFVHLSRTFLSFTPWQFSTATGYVGIGLEQRP